MKKMSVDREGQPINIGDIVRIVGVPDLSGMAPSVRGESIAVFNHLVGLYKRVDELDDYGNAWLRFRILKGPNRGWHSVGIEPFLLRVQRIRQVDLEEVIGSHPS